MRLCISYSSYERVKDGHTYINRISKRRKRGGKLEDISYAVHSHFSSSVRILFRQKNLQAKSCPKVHQVYRQVGSSEDTCFKNLLWSFSLISFTLKWKKYNDIHTLYIHTCRFINGRIYIIITTIIHKLKVYMYVCVCLHIYSPFPKTFSTVNCRSKNLTQ